MEAVFGLGGYGMNRNPRLRALRLGMLVLLLVAGALFNHRGHGYTVARGLYLVALVGLLGYSFLGRRRGRPARRAVADTEPAVEPFPVPPWSPPGIGVPAPPGAWAPPRAEEVLPPPSPPDAS